MIRRPKRGESEDEILKFQEEFLASRQKPSVVVKKAKQADRDVVTIEDGEEPVKKSVSASYLKFPNDKMKRFKIREEDMDPRQKLDAKDKEDISEILTNIQEKDMTPLFNFQADCYKNGFPKAPVIKKDLIDESHVPKTGKKKSLFAQQYSHFNEQKDFGKTVVTKSIFKPEQCVVKKDIVTEDFVPPQLSPKSYIGSDQHNQSEDSSYESCQVNVDEIHQENVQRLLAMGEQEILEEQKKLLDTLDPKIVNFLQTRSKKKMPISSDAPCSSKLLTSDKVAVDGEKRSEDKTDIYHDKVDVAEARLWTNVVEDVGKNKSEDNSKNISESRMELEEDLDAGKTNAVDQQKEGDKTDVDPHKMLGIKKDFVNMDVVEKEKLAWMKDIPKIELKEGNVVPRFDFEGMLIDPTAEIHIDAGLHHHGEEPSLPGYTLEELFHLARSNFPQQRVFSLQLIGRIFDKYHQQQFIGKLSADLLTKCLEAGLIFMLRWSLDEQTEQTYSAAVAAIANVVYVKNDQNLVENYLFTEKGHILPSLCTYYKKKADEMTEAELQEDRDLTDAELVSLDLIKGLLQIQIIPRLRYIIEICNPSIPAVNNCLCILIRMTQHNSDVALEVYKQKLLMPAVFKLLTTANIEYKQETKLYALQLVRCLCQASKSISQDMVKDYKLDEIICAEFTSQEAVALFSSGALYIQVCHIWNILLRYGICTSLVRDLYSVIMSQLQQYSTSYKNLGDKMLASLINILDVAITCTAVGALDWSLIEGLIPLIHATMKTIQKDMFMEEKVTHPYFISALLRCSGTYYRYKNTKLSEVNPVDLLDEVQQYWKDVIQPILSSPLLHQLLDEMRSYSDFKSFKVNNDPQFKCPENLPSHGTYCLSDGIPPSLSNNSPMVIIQALLKLTLQLVSINKTLVVKALPIVIAPETLAYIKFLLESKNLKRCSILISTRVEVILLSHLLELFHLVGSAHGFIKFGQTALNAMQEISIQLICYLQKDDARIAISLMKKIIFNSKIFRKQNYMLWLSEYYENNLDEVMKEQLQTSRNNLQHIGNMYRQMLFADAKMSGGGKCSFLISSLQKKAVPSDWMFYPLVHSYNTSVNVEEAGGLIGSASPEVISTLKTCLEFILLVEVTRPALVANVPETIRLTRLFCLFMTEGHIFNEQSIKDLLISVVAVFSAPSFQSYLNFEMNIPGITSFIDLYKSVVGMYISTSFSDYGFANVLLFPLQLQHDVKYRILIWTEFSEILRIFPLPLNQVICDIKKFLADENENITMIRLYFQGLIGGTCKYNWCPLFYLIAVHHINHFIFSTPSEDMEKDKERMEAKTEKSDMLNAIFASPNKILMEDVVLYKCFDINSERGIGRFSQLPPSRELLVRSIRQNR